MNTDPDTFKVILPTFITKPQGLYSRSNTKFIPDNSFSTLLDTGLFKVIDIDFKLKGSTIKRAQD